MEKEQEDAILAYLAEETLLAEAEEMAEVMKRYKRWKEQQEPKP